MSQLPPDANFPPPTPAAPGMAAGTAKPPTSGMALTAMIMGIAGVLTARFGIGVALGLVAMILGIIALNQIGSEGNREGGRGYAITGIITGVVAFLLLPAISLVALIVGITLPAIGAARSTARQMQNNTQVRGIHQAMVMYAQGNGDNFPGMDIHGNVVDPTVEGRLQILLDNNYFTGDYLINPSETKATWQPGMTLTPQNYSYALLEIDGGIDRQREWSQTLNSDAITLSDRNAGTAGNVYSVHALPGSPGSGSGWRGSVAYNDNTVVYETTHILETQYGQGSANLADDLFDKAGPSDASMIHSGQ